MVTASLPTSPPTASVASPQRAFVSFARGFAILTIVAYHFLHEVALPEIMQKMTLLGGSGIYVYFLMSGYGLALSNTSNWRRFWQRRFTNTLIPYYIAVTLIFAINLVVPVYKTDGWPEYLSHIFLYKMFINSYTRNLGEHFWFVSTIIQFYVLLPLLLHWQARSSTRVFLGGSLLISLVYSVIISLLGVDHLRIWYSFCLQYLWVYSLGIVVARQNWLDGWITRPWYVYVIGVVVGLMIALGIDTWAGAAGSIFNDYFMFAAYGSLLVLFYLISLQWPVVSRVILWFEVFSYSLYLTHMFVIHCYEHVTGKNPLSPLDLVLVVGIAIGVALLFQKGTDYLLAPKPSKS